jgi:hypothetical protein
MNAAATTTKSKRVPAVPEEIHRPPAVGQDADGDLDQEDRSEGRLDGTQERAGGAQVRVCLDAEHDGVGPDDKDDRHVESS